MIVVTLMILSFGQEVRSIYELPLDQCQKIAEAQIQHNLVRDAWCQVGDMEWHFEGEWVEGIRI